MAKRRCIKKGFTHKRGRRYFVCRKWTKRRRRR